MTYEEARWAAQTKADETGQDFAVLGPDHFGGWSIRGLPAKRSRSGYELTCEVAMCSDLSKCWPGHGPCGDTP